MNNFLRMCLNIITQIGPYLVVLLLLKYLVNLQQKRAKEREEEQKKGIIRTHYIIKTEKVLTMFFVLAVFLFGGATVASAIQQDDSEKNKPDGVFVIKQGKTNYKVKVFFDHSSGLTAEDRLKRIIQAEAERESA